MTRTEHLLTIVAEEAVEIAQRATKALRFTLDEVQPGQDLTNAERIMVEFHDLVAAIEMLDLLDRHPEVARAAIKAKKAKVEEFLILSDRLGALQEARVEQEEK